MFFLRFRQSLSMVAAMSYDNDRAPPEISLQRSIDTLTAEIRALRRAFCKALDVPFEETNPEARMRALAERLRPHHKP